MCIVYYVLCVIYIYIYVYASVSVYVYVYAYVRVHVYVYDVCMYVCMHVSHSIIHISGIQTIFVVMYVPINT